MTKDVWLTFQPGSAFPLLHCMHVCTLSLLKFSIKNGALMDFIRTPLFFFFFLTRPPSHLWQHHSTNTLMQCQQQHQHQQKRPLSGFVVIILILLNADHKSVFYKFPSPSSASPNLSYPSSVEHKPKGAHPPPLSVLGLPSAVLSATVHRETRSSSCEDTLFFFSSPSQAVTVLKPRVLFRRLPRRLVLPDSSLPVSCFDAVLF